MALRVAPPTSPRHKLAVRQRLRNATGLVGEVAALPVPADFPAEPETAAEEPEDSLLISLSKVTRLPTTLLQPLLALPSTTGESTLESATAGIITWRKSLRDGLLPPPSVSWPPDESLRNALLTVLAELDLPRYTRRHPLLVDTVLLNLLAKVGDFEAQKAPSSNDVKDDTKEGEDKNEDGDESTSGSPMGHGKPDEAQKGDGEGGGERGNERGNANGSTGEAVDFDSMELTRASDVASTKANKELAEQLAEELREEFSPVLEQIEQAEFLGGDSFNLKDLLEAQGFDASAGLWKARGWSELSALRRVLQSSKELRELVRNLGRGRGRGPLRRAPRQSEQQRQPMGVVLTEETPEQILGLTRSDDLSRMLPVELQMLASHVPAARLLHFARRAERTLLSYQRVGWTDVPAKTLNGTEMRPVGVCGPILVALDTSGSMAGAREMVAKGLVLACMRKALADKRQCIVFAFSGPRECQELVLDMSKTGLETLLKFLQNSFMGGTDVDEPLRRCLSRLQEKEWELADLLFVTDGEIPDPSSTLLAEVNALKENKGLTVHGLLVSDTPSDAVKTLCDAVTVFKDARTRELANA